MIFIYIATVDTRPRGTESASNSVWYRTTTDSELLSRAVELAGFLPSYLFITTWHEVGYYDRHTDLVL